MISPPNFFSPSRPAYSPHYTSLSAKRASIVKLTAKFDMLKATGDSGVFGTDSPDMIIYEKPKKNTPEPSISNGELDEDAPPVPTLETSESIKSLDPEPGATDRSFNITPLI